jgi:hypothetical protein
MKKIVTPLAASALLLVGCGDTPLVPNQPEPLASGSPALQQVPQSSLLFLRPAQGAPSLAALTVTFWAVRGLDREVSIFYHKRPTLPDSTEFLRFKVEKRSLVNRPDGTPIAMGDSIQITLTVVDTVSLIVEFQPAGLVFDPNRPARLWFKYTETDADRDADGAVNATDATITAGLGIWGQEVVGGPWDLIERDVNLMTEQVEAKVPGFTRYAVAY